MKKILHSSGWLVIMFSVLLISCSKKMDFSRSAVVPGADGWVKVDKDNNNNYSIKMKVVNLAKPDQLTPPKKEYVFWVKDVNEKTTNLGRLTSERGMSRLKKASLSTVSNTEPEYFFITAEDDPNPLVPGTIVVMQTER